MASLISGLAVKELHPEKLILYADNALVAMNKPRGLVSQPRNSAEDKMTLALDNIKTALNLENRPMPAHRLDKQTSGLLLLALNHRALAELSRGMRVGAIEKKYLALVCAGASDFPATGLGRMDTTLICENGIVRVKDAPFAKRFPPHRGKSHKGNGNMVKEPGDDWVRQAVTEYRVLATSPMVPLSLLELSLITGCKHQIRAQLAQYLGTPIFGDKKFGVEEKTRQIVKDLQLRSSALSLHSYQATLTRYRPEGPQKRFRLGIGAPIHWDFERVCVAADIPLSQDHRSGGLWVDGQKVRGIGTKEHIQSHTNRKMGEVEDTIGQIGGVWYGQQ
ncbi:pseudouridine synthase [Trametes polyzona]|nr:pseudouridine synthase [Trametes polyzona]